MFRGVVAVYFCCTIEGKKANIVWNHCRTTSKEECGQSNINPALIHYYCITGMLQNTPTKKHQSGDGLNDLRDLSIGLEWQAVKMVIRGIKEVPKQKDKRKK